MDTTTFTDITTTSDVTTVNTSLVEDTNITTTITIGSSEKYLNQIHEDVVSTNEFLAFIVLLLIGGWLYSFLKDLFNQA